MIIAVKNHSRLPDRDVHDVIRAINRQIAEDFEPYWDLGGTLRLAGSSKGPLQADGIIRLYEHGRAYHWGPTGIPEAHVFTTQTEQARLAIPWFPWTVALSHEALELIADPQLNTLVQGPHPERKRMVFHYREVCDPVQADNYQVDGVTLSNFVLPHYFNSHGESGGYNDFLGAGVQAFRWNENGLIGFWDPRKGATGGYVSWPSYTGKHPVARLRRIKGASGRHHRYSHPSVSGSAR